LKSNHWRQKPYIKQGEPDMQCTVLTSPIGMWRRWDFGLISSEQSLEAVDKSVGLHIIGKSKVF